MSIVIRPLAARDESAWRRLWQGYLDFYETPLAPEVTDNVLLRLLDGASPLHGLVAELNGDVVGIAHYLFHPSTWTLTSYCYLEDLFAAAGVRGRGVGRALIEGVQAEARSAGATRFYWVTHETNATARRLYDSLARNAGFIQYRMPL